MQNIVDWRKANGKGVNGALFADEDLRGALERQGNTIAHRTQLFEAEKVTPLIEAQKGIMDIIKQMRDDADLQRFFAPDKMEDEMTKRVWQSPYKKGEGFRFVRDSELVMGHFQPTERDILNRYLEAKRCIEDKQLNEPSRGESEFVARTGLSFEKYVEMFEGFVRKQDVAYNRGALRNGGNLKDSVQNLWKRIKACSDAELDILAESGIITKEEAAHLKARKYYIPNKGSLREDIKNGIKNNHDKKEVGRRINPTAVEYDPVGGTTMGNNMIENLIQDCENAIGNACKNDVRKIMANLIQRNKEYFKAEKVQPIKVQYIKSGIDKDGKPLWTPVEEGNEFPFAGLQKAFEAELKEMAKQGVDKERIKLIKKANEMGLNEIDYRISQYYENNGITERELTPAEEADVKRLVEMRKLVKEGNLDGFAVKSSTVQVGSEIDEKDFTVNFYIDGEEYKMDLADFPTVANAVNGVLSKGEKVGSFFKVLNRFFANLRTTFNISFAPVNLVRDTFGIMMKGFQEYGIGFIGHYLKALNSAKSLRSLNEFVVHESVGGTRANGKEATERDKQLRTFLEEGGAIGFIMQPEIQELIKKCMGDGAKDWKTYIGYISKHAGRYLGEMSELMNRFAVYRAVLDMGKGENSAIWASQNFSTNFSRRGHLGTLDGKDGRVSYAGLRNATQMFRNPSIQGADTMWRSFSKYSHNEMITDCTLEEFLKMSADERNKIAKIPDREKRNRRYLRAISAYMVTPFTVGFVTGLIRAFNDDEKERNINTYTDKNKLALPFMNMKLPMQELFIPFYSLGLMGAYKAMDRITARDFQKEVIPTFVQMLAGLDNGEAQALDHLANIIFADKDNVLNTNVETVSKGLAGVAKDMLVPQPFDVVFDIADGVNFTGAPLSRYDRGFMAQSDIDLTSPLVARRISALMYLMGGGDPDIQSKFVKDGSGDINKFNESAGQVTALTDNLIPSGTRQAFNFGDNLITGAVEAHKAEDGDKWNTFKRYQDIRQVPLVSSFALKTKPMSYRMNIYSKANEFCKSMGYYTTSLEENAKDGKLNKNDTQFQKSKDTAKAFGKSERARATAELAKLCEAFRRASNIDDKLKANPDEFAERYPVLNKKQDELTQKLAVGMQYYMAVAKENYPLADKLKDKIDKGELESIVRTLSK